MAKPAHSRIARVAGPLLLSIAATCFAVLALEIAYRGATAIQDGGGFFHQTNRWMEDPVLGWVTAPGVEITSQEADRQGNIREVRYRTNRFGMRTFSSEPGRCRILVLGDSFTDAIEVSNHETFHSILDERSPCAVFAYGAGGWGNLQELLILEQLVPVTSPSQVILQLSSNDIINNSFELEQRSYWNNLAQRRPYLGTDGVVRQATPYNTPLVSWLRFVPQWVQENFRIVSFVKYRLLRIAASRHGDETIEKRLQEAPEAVPEYQAALEVTRRIFDRMQALAPDARFLAFAANAGPLSNDLLGIAEASGMTVIRGIAGSIADADRQGAGVFSSDGVHWSAAGHRLVAERLLPHVGGDVPPPH